MHDLTSSIPIASQFCAGIVILAIHKCVNTFLVFIAGIDRTKIPVITIIWRTRRSSVRNKDISRGDVLY